MTTLKNELRRIYILNTTDGVTTLRLGGSEGTPLDPDNSDHLQYISVYLIHGILIGKEKNELTPILNNKTNFKWEDDPSWEWNDWNPIELDDNDFIFLMELYSAFAPPVQGLTPFTVDNDGDIVRIGRVLGESVSGTLDSSTENIIKNYFDSQNWPDQTKIPSEIPDAVIPSIQTYFDYIEDYGSDPIFGSGEEDQEATIRKNLIYKEETVEVISPALPTALFGLTVFKQHVATYANSIVNGVELADGDLDEGIYIDTDQMQLFKAEGNNLIVGDTLKVENFSSDLDFILDGVGVRHQELDSSDGKKVYATLPGNVLSAQLGTNEYGGKGTKLPEGLSEPTGGIIKRKITRPATLNSSQQDLWDQISDPNQIPLTWEILREVFSVAGDLSTLDIFIDNTEFSAPAYPEFQGWRLKKTKLNLERLFFDSYLTFADEALSGQTEQSFTQIFNQKAYQVAVQVITNFGQMVAKDIQQNLFDILSFSIQNKLDADETNSLKQNALDQVLQNARDVADELEETTDDIEQEEKVDKSRAMNQCALLANIVNFRKYYSKSINFANQIYAEPHTPGSGYYHNRYFNITSFNPAQTLNVLSSTTSDSDVEAFINLPTEIQSMLVPKIEIKKVYFDAITNKTVTTPIIFDSFVKQTNTIDRPLNFSDLQEEFQVSGRVFRGGACGIKSVSFEFDGETPATAEKYVSCQMELFFQDFNSLFEERMSKKTFMRGDDYVEMSDTYRYIDLVVDPMTQKRPLVEGREKLDHYDPSYYRIMLTVGWSISEKAQLGFSPKSSEYNITKIKRILSKVEKTFLMCALDHDISVSNEGNVSLKIQYRGYGDTLMRSHRFNALLPNNKSNELLVLQEKYESKLSSGKCTERDKAEFAAAMDVLRQKEADRAFSKILTRLNNLNLIHQAKYKDDTKVKSAKKSFKQNGDFGDKPELDCSIRLDEYDVETSTRVNGFFSNTAESFNFFFFGDLFYILLDCVYDLNDNKVLGAENLSFILTDFAIKEPYSTGKGENKQNKIVHLPISCIPITVEYFKNWFAKTIIGLNRSNVPLIDFTLEFLNDVCGCMLSDICFNKNDDKSLMFRQAEIIADSYTEDSLVQELAFYNSGVAGTTGHINASGYVGPDQLFPLKVTSTKTMDELISYQVIYADQQPLATHGVDDIDDFDKGISVLGPGKKGGIVKTASWSKTNVSYLRESRIMSSQGIGGYAQLSNYYNVSLNLFGNFLFFPGMMVYIDPFYLGGDKLDPRVPGKETPGMSSEENINFSRLMGIGGYHLVTSVKSSIASDKFETQIECRFIYSSSTDKNRELNIKPPEPQDITQETQDSEQLANCADIIIAVQRDPEETEEETDE